MNMTLFLALWLFIAGDQMVHVLAQQARLVIFSDTSLYMRVEYRNSECDSCSLRPLTDLSPGTNASVLFDTFYPSYCLFIQDHVTNKNYCPELEWGPVTFGENGTYLLSILKGECNYSCECYFFILKFLDF